MIYVNNPEKYYFTREILQELIKSKVNELMKDFNSLKPNQSIDVIDAIFTLQIRNWKDYQAQFEEKIEKLKEQASKG